MRSGTSAEWSGAMSDLTKRAIDFASESDSFTGQEVRGLVWQLTDRIEADEALMRQALAQMETNQYAVADTAPHRDVMAYNAAIECLRERLGEK